MNNQIPGRILGDRLIKSVKARNLMSRPFAGWGLAVQQLQQAKTAKVRLVELHEDSGRIFSATLERIFAAGQPMKHPGFEPQLLVPLGIWDISDPKQLELFRGGVA